MHIQKILHGFTQSSNYMSHGALADLLGRHYILADLLGRHYMKVYKWMSTYKQIYLQKCFFERDNPCLPKVQTARSRSCWEVCVHVYRVCMNVNKSVYLNKYLFSDTHVHTMLKLHEPCWEDHIHVYTTIYNWVYIS